MRLASTLAVLTLAIAACGDDEPAGQGGGASAQSSSSSGEPAPVFAVESPGPHPVGHATVFLEDAERQRTFPVEIWYPADPADEDARAGAAAGEPIEAFGTTQEERDQLIGLLGSAPDPGTNRLAHAARDAAPAAGPWPFVAFSHCFNGVRFAVFTVAERLASHGIAVVAPDHVGGTLHDELAGESAELGQEFLEVRLGDMLHVLDRTLDPAAEELPEALRGRFDASALGVFGHSFGGVTAGRVLMEDTRPRAGLALTVPMENPLLPGVTLADVHVPLLFLLAEEDNSITKIGNDLIVSNFDSANPPVWRVDVKDAGHWSPTDICGIIDGFDAGCTEGDIRQTNKQPFTYLDANVARGITASYVTAFFLSTLRGDAEAAAYVDGAHPAETVTVSKR
jgi:dienelactone hydrolase